MALCMPALSSTRLYTPVCFSRILFSSFAANTGDRAKSHRAGGPSLLFAGLGLPREPGDLASSLRSAIGKCTELCDRLERREPDRGTVIDMPSALARRVN
jgi:hypothetical protein